MASSVMGIMQQVCGGDCVMAVWWGSYGSGVVGMMEQRVSRELSMLVWWVLQDKVPGTML